MTHGPSGGIPAQYVPSVNEAWSRFADEIGAEFTKSWAWFSNNPNRRSPDVRATVGQLTITFDLYKQWPGIVANTRVRAPFWSKDGFWFRVHHNTWFSALAKLFGMQDIVLGHPKFDHDFIIQANDKSRLQALFDNAEIRELIGWQASVGPRPKTPFRIKRLRGQEVSALYLDFDSEIVDIERLKSYYTLFAATLTQLCEIGSASTIAPKHVRLPSR